MKKLLALALCLVMLVSALCLWANATEKHATTTKLTQLTEIPTGLSMISRDLLAPSVYSNVTWAALTLDEADQYELSRYLTYGISIIGASGLERTLAGAVDGIWTQGNKGGDTLANGKNSKGALSFYPTGELYNHLGETGKEDSIYPAIITMNFGQLVSLDSFGYAAANAQSFIQAADIYVSSDGENWTCVGYYDRPAERMAGSDLTTIADSENSPVDALGAHSGLFVLFDMQDVEVQFLRICGTAMNGITNPKDAEDYSTYHNDLTKSVAMREIVVYGTKLDKPNNVTATEKAPETNAPDNDDATDAPISNIPVKPKETTAEETTTAAPVATTTAAATTAATTEEGGCGAFLTTSALALVGVAATSALVIGRKRKEDQ